MKILLIHTKYTQAGGEDAVVAQELELLRKTHTVEVVYFQNKSGIKGAAQFLRSIWNTNAAQTVRSKIKNFQPDVVHLHNFHFASGPLIIRMIAKMKVPLVQTLHNYRMLCPSAILLHNNHLFLDSLEQSFPWSAVRKKVYRNSSGLTFWLAFVYWFHRKIGTFQKIDRFICLTPFAQNLMQKNRIEIAAEKFVVKPNFTEEIKQHSPEKRGEHFLFIGRLSEEKGIEVLLNAFEQTDFTLKIAGDGPLKETIEKSSIENENIIYLGALKKTEVQREMSLTQALIFPSIWYEGMPMTILEAFSCHTPIIASNLGAMSTIIEHNTNGLHFEAGNAEDLRKQLKNWSTLDTQLLQENAYRSYTEKYAPNLQLQYFNKIYKEAMHHE